MMIPSPSGQIGGICVDPVARVTVELYNSQAGIVEIRTTVEEAGKEPVMHSESLLSEMVFGHFDHIMDSIKGRLKRYVEDNYKPRPRPWGT